MAGESKHQDRHSGLALIFWAAAVYVFISTFPLISPILLSFLLVVLFSLALNPVVTFLRRHFGGRAAATILVLVIFLTVGGLAAWGFYAPVKRSTSKFIERLPEYWERIQRPLLKIEQRAAVSEEKVKQEIKQETTSTNQVPEQTSSGAAPSGGMLRSGASQLINTATGSVKAIAANAATIFMIGITALVGTVFTLLNPRPLLSLFFSFIPKRHQAKALIIARRIVDMVPHWALATLLGMAVIGTLTFLAMWPILGSQDALVLGLIAFVFEAIPFVGPILSVVPALLLSMDQGGWAPAWVLVAYVGIQFIENHFIAPVIVAGRLRLHPVGVIFSILLCVATFGVLGVFLAVPSVAIFNILHEELYRARFLPEVSDEDLESLAAAALDPKRLPEKTSAE